MTHPRPDTKIVEILEMPGEIFFLEYFCSSVFIMPDLKSCRRHLALNKQTNKLINITQILSNRDVSLKY